MECNKLILSCKFVVMKLKEHMNCVNHRNAENNNIGKTKTAIKQLSNFRFYRITQSSWYFE